MKNWLLFWLFVGTGLVAQGQTFLAGKVTEETIGEEIIWGNITLFQNGEIVIKTNTDFDGLYKIELSPGIYDMEVSYLGYATSRIEGVVVRKNKVNKLDVVLTEAMVLIQCPIIKLPHPLIQIQETSSGAILYEEEIKRSPDKDVPTILSNVPGLSFGHF